jgi:hypothetical protein
MQIFLKLATMQKRANHEVARSLGFLSGSILSHELGPLGSRLNKTVIGWNTMRKNPKAPNTMESSATTLYGSAQLAKKVDTKAEEAPAPQAFVRSNGGVSNQNSLVQFWLTNITPHLKAGGKPGAIILTLATAAFPLALLGTGPAIILATAMAVVAFFSCWS